MWYRTRSRRVCGGSARKTPVHRESSGPPPPRHLVVRDGVGWGAAACEARPCRGTQSSRCTPGAEDHRGDLSDAQVSVGVIARGVVAREVVAQGLVARAEARHARAVTRGVRRRRSMPRVSTCLSRRPRHPKRWVIRGWRSRTIRCWRSPRDRRARAGPVRQWSRCWCWGRPIAAATAAGVEPGSRRHPQSANPSQPCPGR